MPDDTAVHVYAEGFVSLSACAPATLPQEQVADEVNLQIPTGISSRWTVSGETEFASGEPHPAPCDQDPENRRHYLLHC